MFSVGFGNNENDKIDETNLVCKYKFNIKDVYDEKWKLLISHLLPVIDWIGCERCVCAWKVFIHLLRQWNFKYMHDDCVWFRVLHNLMWHPVTTSIFPLMIGLPSVPSSEFVKIFIQCKIVFATRFTSIDFSIFKVKIRMFNFSRRILCWSINNGQ